MSGPPGPPESTLIEYGDAHLECRIVPWDTAVFGFPVAEISRLDLGDGPAGRSCLGAFATWCSEREVRLSTCRLDHLSLQESMALEDLGFRFVETVYQPHIELDHEIPSPRRPIDVRTALAEDHRAVEEIARTAFTTGRFLLDQRLPADLSGARYANWVRTSLNDPPHVVLAARSDGDLIGFFIVEQNGDSVYWHLTAVAPGAQGKGLGRDLWRTMLLRHRAEGARGVTTTISGHNLAALNLYARLGFSFGSAQMTFHWLRDER